MQIYTKISLESMKVLNKIAKHEIKHINRR